MIYKSLQLLSSLLNEYLRLSFRLNEDIVFVSPVKDADKVYPANRVAITLAGIDKETISGLNFQGKPISGSIIKNTPATWQLSIRVLICAIFQDKQYAEGLHILTAITRFLQKNSIVASQGGDINFTMDVTNLSLQEMSNLWSIFDGAYLPSVLCRLRLTIDGDNEIYELSGIARGSNVTTGLAGEN